MAAELHIQKLVESATNSPPPESPRHKNPSGHPEDPNPTASGPPPGFDKPSRSVSLEELRLGNVFEANLRPDFNVPVGLRQQLANSRPAEFVLSARKCDLAAVTEPTTHEEDQITTETEDQSEADDAFARAETESGRYLYRKIGEIMREKVSKRL